MITLKKEQINSIIAYAKSQLPNEACGLIAGTRQGEDKRVEKVYLLYNVDQSPEHFSITPQDQLTTLKDARANGWELLGNWHSHPSTPSRPSEEDKRLARDSKASYLILSLAAEEPVLNSFHVEGSEASKEEIIIEE
ncbi:MAG: M67 family metallopeptidase [Clostridia bacterium]|nr:M67 family metallopeptidase [Clostridia bacterium]